MRPSSSHPTTTTVDSPIHSPSNHVRQHTLCPSPLLRDMGWFLSSTAGRAVGTRNQGGPRMWEAQQVRLHPSIHDSPPLTPFNSTPYPWVDDSTRTAPGHGTQRRDDTYDPRRFKDDTSGPRTMHTAQGRHAQPQDDAHSPRTTHTAQGRHVWPQDSAYSTRTTHPAPGQCIRPKDD